MLPVGRALWVARAFAAFALTIGAVQARAQVDIRAAQAPPAPPAIAVVEPAEQTPPKVPHGADVVATETGNAAAEVQRPPHKKANAAPDCVSGTEFDAFKNKVNASWSLDQGAADSVQVMDFPAAPDSGSALGIWAGNIARNLRAVLNQRLTYPQQQEFAALEKQNCPSGRVYCQIAFRQNAVLMLLP